MLRTIKDRAVSLAAGKALSAKFAAFCHMLKLDVDSKTKVLTLETLPKGESETVRVEIRGYRLEREQGRATLCFDSLTVSREWLNSMAQAWLPDNKILLPDGVPLELIRSLI